MTYIMHNKHQYFDMYQEYAGFSRAYKTCCKAILHPCLWHTYTVVRHIASYTLGAFRQNA